MKLLYDYQAFNQHHGGVSRYHVELIRHLRKLGVDCELPTIFSENVYLDEIGAKHYNPLSSWKSSLRLNGMKWVDQKICTRYIEKGDYDIFHPTFLNPYYVGHTKGKPVVPTMYDLINEKFPSFSDSANVAAKRKIVLENATHILSISQQTKNDLIDFYNIDENKISVVYLGAEQDIYTAPFQRIFEKPYVLFVGTRDRYKNFDTFIKAFAQLKEDVDLVCTGVPFKAHEIETFDKLGISKRVHQMFASTDEMNQLMAQAEFFVYPSKAEGFGLPILEAFRCGCPCLISDILCFHEVASDSALYFNPGSVDDLQSCMEKVLGDNETREKLRNAGFDSLKEFSWAKTAKETLEVYKSIL